jgi:EmrB/QacA subfamily drug resistance transporter
MSQGGNGGRLTLAALAMPIIGFALLQSLVVPVLPTIQAALHTTQNNVSWVLTAYLLSAAVLTPVVGRMGDAWGRKRMLLIAIAALAAGCGVSAIAGSLALMIIGRAIQGAGGGILPLAYGIIRDELPEHKVAGAVGVLSALAAAGVGLGLVLAGPVVTNLSYRWLFWIPALLLVVAAVTAHVVVPESPDRMDAGINWPAAVLLCLWLLALLLPISEGPTWGWGSRRVLGLLLLAAVLAAAWMALELRSSRPLIDMRMMRIKVIWTANLVTLLVGVGMYSIFAYLPQYLQTPPSAGYGFGASVTESGLILLPNSIATFAVGFVCGRLTFRYGGRAVLLAGTLISVPAMLMLVLARDHIWEVSLAMTILGAGFGLAFAAMSSLVVKGVPSAQTAVASGMNANIRNIGGAFGAALMSSVISASAHGGHLATNAGYTLGFLIPTVAAVGAMVASYFVPRRVGVPAPAGADRSLPPPEVGWLAARPVLAQDAE